MNLRMRRICRLTKATRRGLFYSKIFTMNWKLGLMYDGAHAAQEIRAATLDTRKDDGERRSHFNIRGETIPPCPRCDSTRPHMTPDGRHECLNCNIIF